MKYESDHTMKNIADLDQDVDVINNTKSTSHYVPWPKIYRKFRFRVSSGPGFGPTPMTIRSYKFLNCFTINSSSLNN